MLKRIKILCSGLVLFLLTANNMIAKEASYSIKLPEKATIQEKTAAAELENYLKKAVKNDVFVNADNMVIFQVGNTEFAKANKIDPEKMQNEEWLIRTVGNNVILCGGGSRGTLYAVYHFLEDIVGVHWWNHCEEYVPALTELRLKDLDLKGKPFFLMRGLYRNGVCDKGHFAARSRLNNDRDYMIAKEFGGAFYFGPPYPIHTFSLYFPESEFKKHPEYFALRNGKRSAGNLNQLCLTNPAMRKEMLRKLKAYIISGEKNARARDIPDPAIYDLSQNDCTTPCECAACREAVRREGSEIGPLLELVHEMAAEIKKFRPQLLISTLAYSYTIKPPKNIKPLKNVVIRLCRTTSNPGLPLSAPEHAEFMKNLNIWSKLTENLYLYDYGTTFGPSTGLPYANEFSLAETFKIYADKGAKYVFMEHECPDRSDMYTMKVWLEAKLMENPKADFGKLYNLFMSKYYGGAAPAITAYRKLLQEAMDKKRPRIQFTDLVESYKEYLTLPLIVECNKLLDQAEKNVASDPLPAQRVRRVRLGLDRYVCLMAPELFKQHLAAGGKPETFPLAREVIAERAKKTHFNSTAGLPAGYGEKEREKFKKEIDNTLQVPLEIRPPAKFAHLEGRYYDYPAHKLSPQNKKIVLAKDPDSETGIVVKIPVDPKKAKEFPLLFGCFNYPVNKVLHVGYIKEIPNAGYNWYKLMQVVIPENSGYIYVYMLSTWELQILLMNVSKEADGKTTYTIWARIKFAGPAFPRGKKIDENAIYVERMIVVKDKR